MPKFTSEDIEELLKYAEDLTVIPSFPPAAVARSGIQHLFVRKEIDTFIILRIRTDSAQLRFAFLSMGFTSLQ